MIINPSIAIVVPIVTDLNLSDDELLSLNSLSKINYTKIQISPVGISKKPQLDFILNFDESHFISRDTYSKLLMSKYFYEFFVNYNYIIIYQTDCLIIEGLIPNNLFNFSYIGAPFYRYSSWIVGNGGLSLRKVKDFLDTFDSKNPSFFDCLFLKFTHADIKSNNFIKILYKKIALYFLIKKIGVKKYIELYSLNEDIFWSLRAPLFNKNFTIASLNDSILFSIEANPLYWLEKSKSLPFGVHAWRKHSSDFWIKYLK